MFGCSTKQVAQPMDYTKEYASVLQKKMPESKVIVKAEMTLTIFDKSGKKTMAFLDNSYKEYVTTPKDKKQIMAKYIEAFIEPISENEVIDTSRITPIIKDRAWLAEIKVAMKARGTEELADHVYEDLNAELVILYAEDSPKNLRYFTTKDLELVNLKVADLKSLAIKNLSKIIPKIETRSGNGYYMVTAGGNYDASLILFESLWDGVQIKVDGDYVIAIPSRDVLLITGTKNKEGIKKISELAIKIVAEGSYHLTSDLFVRREGKFIKYEK
jgi:uncharacterized protein YtpQ (UPF0354 family)